MNSIRRTVAGAVAALALLALTACTPSGPDLSEFEDSTWELVSGSVDGEAIPVPGSEPVTIAFERHDGRMLLVAKACNGLSADLAGWPNGISVGGISGTEMLCGDEDLMVAEAALSAGLPRVDQLTGDASAISLTGDDVEFEFRAYIAPTPKEVLESLADREWMLMAGTVDGVELELPANKLITFGVATDEQEELQLHGHACNGWGMPIKGFPEGMMFMTQMWCSGEISAFDELIPSAIRDATFIGSRGDDLWITGDDFELQWTEHFPNEAQ